MKIKSEKQLMIQILDDNLFQKRLSALRMWNKRAFKSYYFDELELIHVEGNRYKINLFTDPKFKLVYGQIYVECKLKGNVITLIDIQPTRFLEKAFMCYLETYKGMPICDESDLKKIKFLEGIGKF